MREVAEYEFADFSKFICGDFLYSLWISFNENNQIEWVVWQASREIIGISTSRNHFGTRKDRGQSTLSAAADTMWKDRWQNRAHCQLLQIHCGKIEDKAHCQLQQTHWGKTEDKAHCQLLQTHCGKTEDKAHCQLLQTHCGKIEDKAHCQLLQTHYGKTEDKAHCQLQQTHCGKTQSTLSAATDPL